MDKYIQNINFWASTPIIHNLIFSQRIKLQTGSPLLKGSMITKV
jgi:hypothetical protein